jgi:xanthosine utilization system XapX-like protein
VSTSQYILFIGLFAFIVATQVGRREPNVQRLIIPLVIVGVFGFKYLKSFPSGGTALLLVAGGIALGVLFGLLALRMIRVEKDPQTARLVTIAGLAYVGLWTIALLARLGFAFGSTHWFKSNLASFSVQHHVPRDTYATAFVLWVSLMILIRTIGVSVRGYRIGAKFDFSEFRRRHERVLRRSPL